VSALADAARTARATASLARWLGPWADAEARPAVAAVEDDVAGDLRVRIYRPHGPPRATFLIAQGLQYAGADDPRMDRFSRIVCAAGHLVLVPFIPDYLNLIPTPRAIDDFAKVHAARGRWDPEARPPVVFSISFGSLMALGLAARVPAGELARVIVFGGYGDFAAAMRYCLTGEVAGRAAPPVPRDPLNQPVLLMGLVPYLDPPCPDPAGVREGWRRYAIRTWGKAEMKARERYEPIARAIAAELPPAVRDLFLVGTGVAPGAVALALAALERSRADWAALDAAPYLPAIRGRVDIVHGRDDDVIPYEQAAVLAAGLVNADVRVHITGLYNHTGGGARPSPRELGRELATMARLIRMLAAP
jgi:pimeloyl-ACP methyl ester carboxylesterase